MSSGLTPAASTRPRLICALAKLYQKSLVSIMKKSEDMDSADMIDAGVPKEAVFQSEGTVIYHLLHAIRVRNLNSMLVEVSLLGLFGIRQKVSMFPCLWTDGPPCGKRRLEAAEVGVSTSRMCSGKQVRSFRLLGPGFGQAASGHSGRVSQGSNMQEHSPHTQIVHQCLASTGT